MKNGGWSAKMPDNMNRIDEMGARIYQGIVYGTAGLIEKAEVSLYELTQNMGIVFPKSERWVGWFLASTAREMCGLSTKIGRLRFRGTEKDYYAYRCAFNMGHAMIGLAVESESAWRTAMGKIEEAAGGFNEEIDPYRRNEINLASYLVVSAFLGVVEDRGSKVDLDYRVCSAIEAWRQSGGKD